MPNSKRILQERFAKWPLVGKRLTLNPTGLGFRQLTGSHENAPDYPRTWFHAGFGTAREGVADCYPLFVGGLNRPMMDRICQSDVFSFVPQSLLIRDDRKGWDVVSEYRTRRPKGVVALHAQVNHAWQWQLEAAGYDTLRDALGRDLGPNLSSIEVVNHLRSKIREWYSSGLWNAIFLDGAAPNGWMGTPVNPGFSWTPYGVGAKNLIEAVRADHPDAFVIGNSGPGWCWDLLNGYCRENFPNQKPYGPIAHLTHPDYGLIAETLYKAPWLSLLAVDTASGVDPTFALGCACMGQAAVCVAPSDFKTWTADGWELPPEAHVDRSTGMPDGVSAGWLGRSLGPAKPTREFVYERSFVFGHVTVNAGPQFVDLALPTKMYAVGAAQATDHFWVPPMSARFFLWP